MKVLAVSDIHSPLYLVLFRQAIDRVRSEDFCVFVLAGDIIDKGRADMAIPVVKEIKRVWREAQIVAVFGNEEYESSRPFLIKNLEDVIWLDDSYTTIKCDEGKIGVVGTQGALDRLTKWQAKNAPWLSEVYMKRPSFIESTVKALKSTVDKVIVVSHYVLAKGNLVGENPIYWPEMYSGRMEEAIKRSRPDIAIHGHAHRGANFTLLDDIPVFNVSLPLIKRIEVVSL